MSFSSVGGEEGERAAGGGSGLPSHQLDHPTSPAGGLGRQSGLRRDLHLGPVPLLPRADRPLALCADRGPLHGDRRRHGLHASGRCLGHSHGWAGFGYSRRFDAQVQRLYGDCRIVPPYGCRCVADHGAVGRRNRVINTIVGIAAGVLLYDLFLGNAMDKFVQNYIHTGYSSSGAGIRLAMSFVAAAILAMANYRLRFNETEWKLWRSFAWASLVLLGLLFMQPVVHRGRSHVHLRDAVADRRPFAGAASVETRDDRPHVGRCVPGRRPVRLAEFRTARQSLGALQILPPLGRRGAFRFFRQRQAVSMALPPFWSFG